MFRIVLPSLLDVMTALRIAAKFSGKRFAHRA
jgi:hypothetical protein